MAKLQHPVSDEYLRAIGDMTVSFALLEHELHSLTHVLLGVGQRSGRIVTAELGFRAARALTHSLAIERFGVGSEQSKRIRDFLNRAEKLEAARNQITHSIWGAAGREGMPTRYKVTAKERKGLAVDIVSVPLAELQHLVDSIKELGADLLYFTVDLALAMDQQKNARRL